MPQAPQGRRGRGGVPSEDRVDAAARGDILEHLKRTHTRRFVPICLQLVRVFFVQMAVDPLFQPLSLLYV